MNTTEHPVSPETIMAFLDGELSAFESASTAAHLSSCTECSAVIANLHDLSGRFSAWPVESAPVEFVKRVQSRVAPLVLGGETSLPRLPWTWRRWTMALAGTGFGLILLFAIATPDLLRSRMTTDDAVAVARGRSAEREKTSSRRVGALAVDTANSRDISAYNASVNESKSTGGGEALPPPPPPAAPLAQKTTGLGAAPETMIARMVELQITAAKFDGIRSLLDAILARHGGYAAELAASTHEGNARSIRASLRIPAQELAAALTELKSLGRVESETQAGEEVTQQHADLVARLKNSREEEQRLQAILTQRTGKISDVLEVEQEIARIRGEIEQIEAEQKSLEHRVTFATVNLQLNEEYKAALDSAIPPTSTRLHNAAVTGYRDAVESVVSLLLFLAEAGPTLLLWFAVLFFPARWTWRRFRVALARA